MTRTPDISQWDLLAYADGRLEPERAREVAAALAADPELREKVADFTRQNTELAAQYDAYAEAPLPTRLSNLLAAPEPRRSARRSEALGHLRRAAAMLVAVVGAGAGGWWLGDNVDGGERAALEALLHDAASIHMRNDPRDMPLDLANTGDGQPLNWFSDRVSLQLTVPDLRDQGYALVEKRRVTLESAKGIYLRYAAEDAAPLDVFLHSRWNQSRPARIETARREGVTLAHWLDGPLRVVVAGGAEGRTAEVNRLAEVLRTRLRDSNNSDGDGSTAPKLKPHGGHGDTETAVQTPDTQQTHSAQQASDSTGEIPTLPNIERSVLETER